MSVPASPSAHPVTLISYRDVYTHMHTHRDCESALNKYGCLHPDLPVKQSRLFKQQPVKASIQFYSEARFPLNGPLSLSDNSSLPEKKHWNRKKKRKRTYFPVQSNPCSIAMAPDIRLFLSLTRRGPPQPLASFTGEKKRHFFVFVRVCVCA